MSLIPGPFAPTVTQHIPGTPTEDRYHDTVPGTPRDVKRVALAEYPGNSVETDNAAGDVIVADLVLLLDPSVPVTAQDEWTASDGLRYRVEGQPARYLSPFTGTAVTQVNLRRIT